MPRPGPRPYECVRRAWHSDRHQPMRGSLIQEIFRLANEVHSNSTRKNKEWQEKLPFVVLKAEEIMYSKANSEAEYMDLKTLWERANDAIDTIIRKDDANESGDLLQPCIEAALNLGCIPRRASRSQRHNNPVCYLNSNLKEADAYQKSQDNNKSLHLSSTSMLPPPPPVQSSHLHYSSNQLGSKYPAMRPEIQFIACNSSKDQKAPFENSNKEFPYNWPNLGCVFPLYYGEGHCAPNFQLPSRLTKTSFLSSGVGDATFSPEFMARKKMNKLPLLTECDLSLRLGPPSPPSSEVESSGAHEIEDVGSSSSCDGNQSCGPLLVGAAAGTNNLESSLSSAREKGFDFFSVDNIDEHYGINSSGRNQMGYVCGALTDQCFSWKS